MSNLLKILGLASFIEVFERERETFFPFQKKKRNIEVFEILRNSKEKSPCPHAGLVATHWTRRCAEVGLSPAMSLAQSSTPHSNTDGGGPIAQASPAACVCLRSFFFSCFQ